MECISQQTLTFLYCQCYSAVFAVRLAFLFAFIIVGMTKSVQSILLKIAVFEDTGSHLKYDPWINITCCWPSYKMSKCRLRLFLTANIA
jgi:hypothetical protein